MACVLCRKQKVSLLRQALGATQADLATRLQMKCEGWASYRHLRHARVILISSHLQTRQGTLQALQVSCYFRCLHLAPTDPRPFRRTAGVECTFEAPPAAAPRARGGGASEAYVEA